MNSRPLRHQVVQLFASCSSSQCGKIRHHAVDRSVIQEWQDRGGKICHIGGNGMVIDREPHRACTLLCMTKSCLIFHQELSGVGRRVKGREDQDEAHATGMDDWIVWEKEGTGGRGSYLLFLLYLDLIFQSLGRGTDPPSMVHSAGWGWRISCVSASTQRRQPVSVVIVYIPLRGEPTLNENQSINQPRVGSGPEFWFVYIP
jgi:hypothetical protein